MSVYVCVLRVRSCARVCVRLRACVRRRTDEFMFVCACNDRANPLQASSANMLSMERAIPSTLSSRAAPVPLSIISTQSVLGTGFVGCLTSQRHASVSRGRICTDNFTCCHTEIEVAVLPHQVTVY